MTAREYKNALYKAIAEREEELRTFLNGTETGTTAWYMLNGRLFATTEIKHRIADTPTGEGKHVDWIREMDVTKLSEFLAERGCPDSDTVRHCNEQNNCYQCWLDWLNDYGG